MACILRGERNLVAFKILMVIFLIICVVSIFTCIILTMRVYFEHIKMKKELEDEIKHIRKERDTCLELLRRKGDTPHGS